MNEIIELAIFKPHAYPWENANLEITIDELDSILKDLKLRNEMDRRSAAFSLDIICYLNAIDSESYIDLLDKIKEDICDKAYFTNSLVEKQLANKKLNGDEEIRTFKKFINNTMTVGEKKYNAGAIEMWLVELVHYCKLAEDSNIDSLELKDVILNLLQENYKEINSRPFYIDKLRKSRGVNRNYNYKAIHNTAKEYREKLEALMVKYLGLKKEDLNFEDQLFDLINNISEYEGDEDENENDEREDLISRSIFEDKKVEVKSVIEKKEEVSNTKEVVTTERTVHFVDDNIVYKNLKALASSLGYKLVSKGDILDDSDEIGMLIELASYKKGAILSELYNAYMDIENVSKENLEAIINNFFTTLKLGGFEADDNHSVGDKVELNTKDLLVDFVLTQPVREKGIIEGEIRYLPWIYKGKKVTPMVVKPIIE